MVKAPTQLEGNLKIYFEEMNLYINFKEEYGNAMCDIIVFEIHQNILHPTIYDVDLESLTQT